MEEIRLRDEQFRIALENSDIQVWDYNFSERTIVQSSNLRAKNGLPQLVKDIPESMIRSGYVYPEYAAVFTEMYKKLVDGAKEVEGIFKVKTTDKNGFRFEQIQYKTIFDSQGKAFHAIGLSQDVTEKQLALESKAEAEKDSLTKVLSRAAFIMRVKRILQNSETNEEHVLILFDVDHFKSVNDTFGHQIGDQVLFHIAEKLSSSLRTGDLIGRIGGDEFMIFMKNMKEQSIVESRIKELLQQALYEISPTHIVSISIGAVLYPKDGQTFEMLYEKADHALYYVKRTNRGSFALYNLSMEKEAQPKD